MIAREGISDAERERLASQSIFTPAEYAVLAGRSKSWTVEACAKGLLPAIRDGSRWILRRRDLETGGWL